MIDLFLYVISSNSTVFCFARAGFCGLVLVVDPFFPLYQLAGDA